jgi:hypothetical protein
MNPLLKKLYEVYQSYRDKQKILSVLKDYKTLEEKRNSLFICTANLKVRALGSIIKINKDSEEPEILSSICNFWIELRSEWVRLNTVNNYNLILNGEADDVNILLSAFISGMIESIEPLIPEAELNKMNEVMVQVQYGSF